MTDSMPPGTVTNLPAPPSPLIGAVVGLGVEDGDAGRPARLVDPLQAGDHPKRLHRRLSRRILRVQVGVQGVEEQHRRLGRDDGVVCHGGIVTDCRGTMLSSLTRYHGREA